MHQTEAVLAFKNPKNDTVQKFCYELASKVHIEQQGIEESSNSNCFVAVAVYKSDEKIFQSMVDPQIGYFYEYQFTTQPFDERYNLVVKYGFDDAKTHVC